MERLSKELDRHKGDMSLRELARRLDVSPATVETWLKGWRTPGFDNVHRLAGELGVEPIEVARWILDDVAAKKGVTEVPIIHGLSSGRRRPKDSRPPSRSLPLPAA